MQVIQPCNLSEIDSFAFKNNLLQVLPFSFYEDRNQNEIKYFMYKHGIYVLPTTELITFLSKNIIGLTIEIGAGLGAIGRSLNIKMTDSYLQADPLIAQYYK